MYCNKLDKIGLKYSYTLKYIKSDGDMEHTNGNNIITERPVRNYNIHVPRLQSCPFTGQTMEIFTTATYAVCSVWL